MRRAALAVVLLACTKSSVPPPAKEAKQPIEPTVEPIGARAPPDAPRSHVVLVKHESTAAKATFVAVDVTGDFTMALRDVAAAPIKNWPDHFRWVAAHGGGATFITQRPKGEGWELVRFDVAKSWAEKTVSLPGPADGMHLAGAVAWIGIGNRVLQVDFNADAPRLEPLVERKLASSKAYDLFVRTRDTLFAIDDMVSPMYADSFQLQGDGTAKHVAGFELPGVINGIYVAGAYDNSNLYLIAEYGIMSGHGHDLAALPVEGGKTKHGGDVILNSTVSTDPMVLEEHVSRETDKPEKLAFGTEFTDWPSVEVLGTAATRRLLLPAGKRGLLSIPVGFTPETKAEVVVPGSVQDVKVDATRVFVLVGRQLVEFSAATNLEEVRRVNLPTGFQRIVD